VFHTESFRECYSWIFYRCRPNFAAVRLVNQESRHKERLRKSPVPIPDSGYLTVALFPQLVQAWLCLKEIRTSWNNWGRFYHKLDAIPMHQPPASEQKKVLLSFWGLGDKLRAWTMLTQRTRINRQIFFLQNRTHQI